MNSSLYDCVVMHHRLVPLKHRFVYKVFMFYLDVDELDELGRRSWLFSRNRFNLFSFRDRDHLWLDRPTVRENVVAYLKTKGVDIGSGRIMLLTNVRTLGYVFNPVSFYFCFDEAGEPVCAVPEVGNTFRELKPYLLRRDALKDGTFRERQTKHFYVSPFFDLDTVFEFQLGIPGERLQVKIDDFQQEKKAFVSALTGTRREFTDGMLAWSFLRIPFVTLKVIFLIHWHAMLLYLKKLPFHRKHEHPELQQEVYVWNK